MSVSDDRTGERVACSKCQAAITVPVPIGGRLTEHRLTASPPQPSLSQWPPPKQDVLDEVEEPIDEEGSLPADIPPDPGMGFRTDLRLPKLLRRNERPAIEEAARQILDDTIAYLENEPQNFQSGSLVLEVDRFEYQHEWFRCQTATVRRPQRRAVYQICLVLA